MNNYFKLAAITAICTATQISTNALANDSITNTDTNSGWYVRPIIGLSNLSDTNGSATALSSSTNRADINTDSGFVAGLGVGYQYTKNFSAELAWEYRTNDSSATFSNGQTFESGDYASNIFMLNGFYHFDSKGKWRPYVGAGLMLVQEIDIDLESAGQENSFSANGDVGAQIFAGLDYQLSDRLTLQSELRIGSLSDLELESETTSNASISGLDYKTTTFQVGLKYSF